MGPKYFYENSTALFPCIFAVLVFVFSSLTSIDLNLCFSKNLLFASLSGSLLRKPKRSFVRTREVIKGGDANCTKLHFVHDSLCKGLYYRR